MAMTDRDSSIEALEPSKARLAGAVASALGLAGTLAGAFWLIWQLTAEEAPSHAVAYLLVLTGFFGLGLVAGVQLLRGRGAWQPFLLVYWLAIAVAATILTLGVILHKVPEGLAKQFGDASAASLTPWATLLGVAVLILAALVAVLLAMAAQMGSRQRYASMVIVSVAAVHALVVVLNMLAQYENPEKDRKNYVHVSVETLGSYGLSDRTKQLLSDAKGPVRLTCVYTSSDEDKQTDELRPRVLELLEDMKIYAEGVTVESVTTDAEKARLLGRLRGELAGRADKHQEFVREFLAGSEAFLADVQARAQQWQSHPTDSYLNQWGLAVEIASALGDAAEKLEKARTDVQSGLGGTGLPDYAELVRSIKDGANDFKEIIEKSTEFVESIRKIAEAAGDPNRQGKVRGGLDELTAAGDAMAGALGKADDPVPADPAPVLRKYVEAAKDAAGKALAAGRELDNLAGEDQAKLLRQHNAFGVPMGVVSIGLSDYFRAVLAKNISDWAANAEAIAQKANPAFQKEYITKTRLEVQQIVQSIAQARRIAERALGRLATVDKLSQQAFDLAGKDQLFAEPLKKVKALLDKIEDLPKLENTTLSSDITGENIVIVEAAGKTEVVDFDEVWPLRSRDFGMGGSDGPRKRLFNGDAAIGSKVLKMTNEPFAVVLLAHWGPGPDMPPQMARMTAPSDIPAQELGALRRRLEAANFRVEDWNLNEDRPDPNEAKGRPKMMIVLPPPPPAQQSPWERQPMPTPSFEDEHRQKVVDAIDEGIPAVFLTTFSPPRSMGMFMPPTQTPYAYREYLRSEWGIEAMTDYLVVPAVPDDKVPGRFKVDGQRFSFLPLTAFNEGHPVGKPLRTQRVLWANLCPVGRAKDARGEPKPPPAGVTIEPLLSVPESWRSTWATSRIQDLLRMFTDTEGSYIWPNYEEGDLRVPFDVAVAATRAEDKDKNITPARIVVLGTGQSLMDGYLDREVPVRDDKGTISLTDPPRANADLVVNGVYWLIGREGLIASGPAVAVMREIDFPWKVIMFAFYFVLLPLGVVGIGLAVLHRRSA